MLILKSFNFVFACKNTTISHKSVKLHIIFIFFFRRVRYALSRIAYNEAATWRQAGASARFGREQRMMLPALYHTNLYPRLRQTAR